jgi:hypothetical protein
LDKVKGFDIGETYMNEKAATNFIKYIGISEREQTISLLEKSPVFSFSISNQGPGWLNELGRWI